LKIKGLSTDRRAGCIEAPFKDRPDDFEWGIYHINVYRNTAGVVESSICFVGFLAEGFDFFSMGVLNIVFKGLSVEGPVVVVVDGVIGFGDGAVNHVSGI